MASVLTVAQTGSSGSVRQSTPVEIFCKLTLPSQSIIGGPTGSSTQPASQLYTSIVLTTPPCVKSERTRISPSAWLPFQPFLGGGCGEASPEINQNPICASPLFVIRSAPNAMSSCPSAGSTYNAAKACNKSSLSGVEPIFQFQEVPISRSSLEPPWKKIVSASDGVSISKIATLADESGNISGPGSP